MRGQRIQIDTTAIDSSAVLPERSVLEGSVNSAVQSFNLPGFLMNIESSEWFFFFTLALLIGYATARYFLGDLLSKTYQASVRYNVAIKIFNDNSLLQRQIDFALNAFYFISGGFFLMIIMERTGWLPYHISGIKLLGLNMLFLFLLFSTRYIVLNIIGHVFEINRLLKEYLYHSYFYNKLMGILLIPFNFLLLYTADSLNKIIFWLTISTIIVLFMLKIVRGLFFSLRHGVLNIYLFLYLCALEIVPLLLLIKWFVTIAQPNQ